MVRVRGPGRGSCEPMSSPKRLKVKDVCLTLVVVGAIGSVFMSRTEAQRQISMRNEERAASMRSARESEARVLAEFREERAKYEASSAAALSGEKKRSGAIIEELEKKGLEALDALRTSREAGARLSAEVDGIQAQLDAAREERAQSERGPGRRTGASLVLERLGERRDGGMKLSPRDEEETTSEDADPESEIVR